MQVCGDYVAQSLWWLRCRPLSYTHGWFPLHFILFVAFCIICTFFAWLDQNQLPFSRLKSYPDQLLIKLVSSPLLEKWCFGKSNVIAHKVAFSFSSQQSHSNTFMHRTYPIRRCILFSREFACGFLTLIGFNLTLKKIVSIIINYMMIRWKTTQPLSIVFAVFIAEADMIPLMSIKEVPLSMAVNMRFCNQCVFEGYHLRPSVIQMHMIQWICLCWFK